MVIEEQDSKDKVLQEGSDEDHILYEGETPSDFTDYWLPDQIADHYHESSPNVIHLLRAIQEFFHYDTIIDAESFPEFHNPDKVPIELIEGLEEMINASSTQIRGQSDESRRRQLKRTIDWIRLKGRTIAVRSYLDSVGFSGSTEVKVSDDYSNTFFTDSEALERFGKIPDDFFYTPHVELEFTNTQLIDGEILTQEIFDILKERVLDLSPATAVFDWKFQIRGVANEEKTEVKRNFVTGSTSDTYQRYNSEPINRLHESNDGIEARRTFQYMDVEYWDEWKIGTYSGDVSSFNSFDSVLKSSTDLDITLRPDLGETQVRVTIGDPGGSYNAIAFYHNGNIRALYKFPEISTFDTSDLEVEFVAIVREANDNFHFTSAIEDSSSSVLNDQSENNYIFATSNYDFGWDRSDDVEANWGFEFNQGLNYNDTDKNRSYASILTQSGYFKLGTLAGEQSNPDTLHTNTDGNGNLEMHDPVTGPCDNFHLQYMEGFGKIRVTADLIQSEAFGSDIQQIGFFNNSDELILVAQLDDPINFTDQFNSDKFQLDLQIGAE